MCELTSSPDVVALRGLLHDNWEPAVPYSRRGWKGACLEHHPHPAKLSVPGSLLFILHTHPGTTFLENFLLSDLDAPSGF